MSARCSFAWLACAAAVALGAHVAPARADDATTDVDVSRITLKLRGGGWNVSDKLPYGAAVDSSPLTVGGERRVITAGRQHSRDGLVMLVSATRGERGISTHAECEPQDGVYVRKFNRGQSNYIPLQCLRVEGPANFPADPTVFGEDFAAVATSRHVAMPPDGYVVTVVVSNDNGASVEILALIGSHFTGLPDKSAAAPLPDGMPSAVAAWADQLAEEALGTLSSWSGRMTVPPVAFRSPSPPPPAARNTALAASAAIKD